MHGTTQTPAPIAVETPIVHRQHMCSEEIYRPCTGGLPSEVLRLSPSRLPNSPTPTSPSNRLTDPERTFVSPSLFRHSGPGHAASVNLAMSKVPQVTLLFWIAKLLTTGMGETLWDWAGVTLGPVLALAISVVGFLGAMTAQLLSKAYNAWLYWMAICMVSVFGTTVADVVHVIFGVPYWASTLVLAVAVAVLFVSWYRVEGTLSIHSIRTCRRELFYWSGVLLTFALGTAAGDWTATSLHLGYLLSAVLFAVVFVLPAVGYWRLGLDPILSFWLSYIMTRPLGASLADWVGVPSSRGGLGLGTGGVSLVLAVLIVAVVAYFSITRTDVERIVAAPTMRIASRQGPK